MSKMKKDENGLVAILVASLIMVIMSLVVLGFARLMQREQREALDKSLSTQAFYAAESGINDVIAQLHDPAVVAAGGGIADKPTCDTTTGLYLGSIDSNLKTNYSCLIVNNTPTSLEYTGKIIGTGDATKARIRGAHNEVISSMEVSWGDASISTPAWRGCTSGSGLPIFSNWGASPGILRFDLVKTDPVAGNITRANMLANFFNSYLYPVSLTAPCGNAANQVPFATNIAAGAGKINEIHCVTTATPRECVATITGINAQNLLVRMKSVYHASDVTIRIFDGTGKQLPIAGAQVVIDSTGRVAEVLRRMQVRVPQDPSYDIPDKPLETSQNVCKELAVQPGIAADLGPDCNSL